MLFWVEKCTRFERTADGSFGGSCALMYKSSSALLDDGSLLVSPKPSIDCWRSIWFTHSSTGLTAALLYGFPSAVSESSMSLALAYQSSFVSIVCFISIPSVYFRVLYSPSSPSVRAPSVSVPSSKILGQGAPFIPCIESIRFE
uniref:(northern house mosquito) hypothetical protein n=1 Tax=Culex pipiens TaxID=7175 RepID=A0A8D8BRA2_CULPI